MHLKRNILLNSLAIILFIITLAITIITVSSIYLNHPGPLQEDKVILIKKGQSSKSISFILAKENVINYPYLFWFVTKFTVANHLKAGEYKFTKNLTPGNVLDIIKNGKIYVHFITIPEGNTNYEIIEKLNNIKILTGSIINKYSEGKLLPETYSYIHGDRRQKILDRMKQRGEDTLNKLWLQKSANLPYKNKDEALVMASIIEKETSQNLERKRVAAVFINRLNRGMKLQADPTVSYALTMGGPNLPRKLSRRDLKFKSPYNTYYSYGLPPKPISNPGYASIEAALNPIQSDELYFVVNGKGGHNFATTLRQHINNVIFFKKLKNIGKKN